MERRQVYKILDGERAYQDEKWGGNLHDRNHAVESWMTYMDYYLHQAKRRISTEAGVQGGLDELRKVVALGIACFEANGVPKRDESEIVLKKLG